MVMVRELRGVVDEISLSFNVKKLTLEWYRHKSLISESVHLILICIPTSYANGSKFVVEMASLHKMQDASFIKWSC